jgi:sarcosine oxidase subunit gamma
MLDRVSALASAKPYSSNVLKIEEVRGFSLMQVSGLDAGFEGKLAALAGKLPAKVGVVAEHDGRAIMRIGPAQFWIIAPETDDLAPKLGGICAVTPLGNSRVRIRLAGAPARDVLSKLMPLDFHPAIFTPGTFAMSGIHHTPVTVHCIEADAFDLYVLRTFALNVWEVITDAALEYC